MGGIRWIQASGNRLVQGEAYPKLTMMKSERVELGVRWQCESARKAMRARRRGAAGRKRARDVQTLEPGDWSGGRGASAGPPAPRLALSQPRTDRASIALCQVVSVTQGGFAGWNADLQRHACVGAVPRQLPDPLSSMNNTAAGAQRASRGRRRAS